MTEETALMYANAYFVPAWLLGVLGFMVYQIVQNLRGR